MTAPSAYPLKFQAGARTLLSVHRRLIRCTYDLAMAREASPPILASLDSADGYMLRSLPQSQLDGLDRSNLLVHVRQYYVRYFADFGGGFEAYMASFSGKTRATLKRKLKRFSDDADGRVEARMYRTPEEIAEFARLAIPLSQNSYQHKLLGAGLPADAAAQNAMRTLAAADQLRAFLLFKNGRPVAYLYLPVAAGILIYAYLGYDSAEAKLSPGTVLQLEAIRMLAEEGRYTILDFTEGEGEHKRLFSTGGIACADVLMLRPTLANRLLLGGMRSFDDVIDRAKRLSGTQGFAWLKSLRR